MLRDVFLVHALKKWRLQMMLASKVQPQRVAARHQKKLLCAMAFQDLEWHAVDDVDFDDAEADILEIDHESGTPVLDGIEPVWTTD